MLDISITDCGGVNVGAWRIGGKKSCDGFQNDFRVCIIISYTGGNMKSFLAV